MSSAINVIDWSAELLAAQSLPASRRLSALLAAAGCQAHPQDGRFILGPSARLWCVGGIPAQSLIDAGMPLDEVAALALKSIGTAGSMSYLSLPGGSPESAFDKIIGEMGHCSAAHVASVSVVVAGVTCLVENEFNSQRDLVHLARVTEARSSCQGSPSMVVQEPAIFSLCQQALDAVEAIVASAPPLVGGLSRADANEALNSLFPSSKATVFIITGSLRNFQKMLAAKNDEGKEKEYRRILTLIHQLLGAMWPALFPSSEEA